MNLSNDWKDYELIDASCGEKYERWGNIYILNKWDLNIQGYFQNKQLIGII